MPYDSPIQREALLVPFSFRRVHMERGAAMLRPAAFQKSGCGHFFEFCSLSLIAALPAAKGCNTILYLILFSNSTDTSTRAFSILASAHSTRRSAATPRSIPVSQNEKFASYLVPFSFENSITQWPMPGICFSGSFQMP